MNIAASSLIIGACLIVTGCEPVAPVAPPEETTVPAAPTGPITSEAAFRDIVVGRRLLLDTDFVVIDGDGTMNGTSRGAPYTGTWNWDDRYFCHSLSTDGPDEGQECMTFTVTDDGLRATRNRGFGQSIPFRFG